MAIPSISAVGYSDVQDANLSFSDPGGSNNDLLLICAHSEKETTSQDLPASLTGWNVLNRSGDNTETLTSAIYWRIHNGSESWPVTVTTSGSGYKSGSIMVITDNDTSDPFDVDSGTWDGINSTASSLTVSGVTTTVANTLAICFATFDGRNGEPASTSSTGWTEYYDLLNPGSGSPSIGLAYWAGTKSMATATGTGDCVVDWTGGTDGCIGFIVTVKEVQPASIPLFMHHYTKNISGN